MHGPDVTRDYGDHSFVEIAQKLEVLSLRQVEADEDRRQMRTAFDLLRMDVLKINTTIKVTTALLGFLVAIAGIVVPLAKG